MIGGNKSSRCFSSFSSPCLFGKFRMVWSTSALSITASILAFTMSSASLSLHLDWSSNMCRYSVTVSCFSSIDKTFHVAGHLSSFPRPSNATCHQKCKIKNIYDNYLLLYVYFSDNVLRMISITSQNKMKQYTMELRLTTTELKSCQSFFLFKNAFNSTTSLIQPDFGGLLVVRLTGFNCILRIILGNYYGNKVLVST